MLSDPAEIKKWAFAHSSCWFVFLIYYSTGRPGLTSQPDRRGRRLLEAGGEVVRKRLQFRPYWAIYSLGTIIFNAR
jgi:hypothetical protein